MKWLALVVLVATEGAEVQEAPRLPKVPHVFNEGADGMPHLPDVDTLLEKYQDMNDLNFAGKGFVHHLASVELDVQGSSVDSFSEHLAKVQRESRQRIAQQTAKYEAQLQGQEKENKVLVRLNAHLARNILMARQQYEEMQKKVSKEKKLVAFRRKEIQKLEQQMSKGQKFLQIVKVEDVTMADANDADVDGISFLEVSKTYQAREVLDATSFLTLGARAAALDVTRGLDEDAAPSAEALAAVAAEKAEDQAQLEPNKEDNQIINLLTQDLRKLHQAEVKIKKKLENLFHQSMEAGEERHEALKKEKMVLTQELETTEASLKASRGESKKLQKALKELELSLKEGAAFFNDMSKVSVAPVKKVPALLKEVLAHFH